MPASRSVVYGGLVVLTAASIFFLQGSEPDKATSGSHSVRAGVAAKPEDVANSYRGPAFDPPQGTPRDIFMPKVKADERTGGPSGNDEPAKVPSALAGGDPNWAYTGFAEVDGQKLALLENSANQQSGFLKEGQHWKKATVLHITAQSIVFADENGVQDTVLRFNANQQPKPKPAPESGFQPVKVEPNLQGQIGQNIQALPQVSDGNFTIELNGGGK